MSVAAEFVPSSLRTSIPPAPAVEGRRPVLALVIIGASTFATVAWAVAMVWTAVALLGQL
jgi:hypothetical protein